MKTKRKDLRSFYGPLVDQGIPIRTTAPSMRMAIPGSRDSNRRSVTDVTHPEYDKYIQDWQEWRCVYKGGQQFVEEYLVKFSRREHQIDFEDRKRLTPIPAFAAAAIDDVKNSIFQRMADITRTGGPPSYTAACKGQLGGVNRSGATMNFFIGDKIISELITMKKVGVFVDMPPNIGRSKADKGNKHPYIYQYRAEDIRSWSYLPDSEDGSFAAVLLRHYENKPDPTTKLPSGVTTTFRHYYLDANDTVSCDVYNEKGVFQKKITSNLTEIPFVVFELTESLLKNISRHQIALLNLGSSDMNQVMKGNVPFYTEQVDPRSQNSHLRRSMGADPEGNDPDYDANEACRNDVDNDEDADNLRVGIAHGRKYAKGLERPGFIAPPVEPLQASMAKQEKLRDEIRLLVNLNLSAVQNKMASAESKGFDQQGLEAGLSYIGLELENGERKIAKFWAMYEGAREIPTVKYPERYSLVSQEDIQKNVDHLKEVRAAVPSITFKREATKRIAALTLGNKVSLEQLKKIQDEIDKAPIIPDEPDTLLDDVKANVLSLDTLAKVKCYPSDEVEKAGKDAEIRLKRVQAAQTPKNGRGNLPPNPAARGLPTEADPNPQSGSTEKQGKPKRGQGR